MSGNPPLTREGLIWQAAFTIATAEGKTDGRYIMGGRQYTLDLLKEAAAVVDNGLLLAAAASAGK